MAQRPNAAPGQGQSWVLMSLAQETPVEGPQVHCALSTGWAGLGCGAPGWWPRQGEGPENPLGRNT